MRNSLQKCKKNPTKFIYGEHSNVAQQIIKSTGNWEKDKLMLKERYGLSTIPVRVIADILRENKDFVYWLVQTGKLGTRMGRSYHIHLPQLIAYVEGTYSAFSLSCCSESEIMSSTMKIIKRYVTQGEKP